MPRGLKASYQPLTPAKHLAEASLMMIEARSTCSRQQLLQLHIHSLPPTKGRGMVSK